MKRQIKFRGKTTANGHWVYGSLIVYDDNTCAIRNSKSQPWVDPKTVGQFTGFRDRNCREIYEGDILSNYDEPNPLTVRWDTGGCFFGLFNSEGDCECDFTSLEIRLGIAVDAEIVGNIHDNSEQCPEFPYFGASYPDARCVDGILHDLDDCDENGNLYVPTEKVPCPFCRPKDFMEYNSMTEEEFEEYITPLRERYG